MRTFLLGLLTGLLAAALLAAGLVAQVLAVPQDEPPPSAPPVAIPGAPTRLEPGQTWLSDAVLDSAAVIAGRKPPGHALGIIAAGKLHHAGRTSEQFGVTVRVNDGDGVLHRILSTGKGAARSPERRAAGVGDQG